MFELLRQALARIAQIIGSNEQQQASQVQQPQQSIPQQSVAAQPSRQDVSSQIGQLNLPGLGGPTGRQSGMVNPVEQMARMVQMSQMSQGGLPQNFQTSSQAQNPFGLRQVINQEPIKTAEFNPKTKQFDQVFRLTQDRQMKIEKLPDGFTSIFISEDNGNTWRDMTEDEEIWIPRFIQNQRPDIIAMLGN